MKKILIIDDMDGVREAMTVLLEVAGYDISTAKNGEEGSKKAVSGNYDLIITDILMPELDGNEMIMKIRENSIQVPIIAMSAGGNGVGSEAALSLPTELGLTTLEKPFSKAQLLETVNSILTD